MKNAFALFISLFQSPKSHFCEFIQRIYMSLAKRLDITGLIHQIFHPKKSVLPFSLRDLLQVSTHQEH